MRDRPAGPELLELAERAARGDPSLAVPGDSRYRDLMIARARAIAERQGEAGDGPERREAADLAAILGREGTLSELNRALSAAIREGIYDPGTPDANAVGDLLWRTVTARVAESNPKALAGKE